MKTIILVLLIAFALLRIGNVAHAQYFDSTLAAKLQTSLDSVRAANSIRGISASVIYPGQGMWQGTSGVSYSTVPITSAMEFGIASNTKLFTAVALLKLAENGLVEIDDSLYRWLPTFGNIDPTITVRQILNHTSGIEDVTNYPGYADSILSNPNRIFTPYELMNWVGPPLFPAGTGWSYSNTNYVLAGMVFESASGQNIARFLRDSVLTPLQLDSTFFDVHESVLGTIAHPWQNGIDISSTPRISLNSSAWAAGAMYSTSGEMAQWYQALMGGRVLTDDNICRIWQLWFWHKQANDKWKNSLASWWKYSGVSQPDALRHHLESDCLCAFELKSSPGYCRNKRTVANPCQQSCNRNTT
jgi:D-alanyl-D-alanine carboxypeptidase